MAGQLEAESEQYLLAHLAELILASGIVKENGQLAGREGEFVMVGDVA
ncbi:hypothetical protein [Streptomyces collinus]